MLSLFRIKTVSDAIYTWNVYAISVDEAVCKLKKYFKDNQIGKLESYGVHGPFELQDVTLKSRTIEY